MKKETGQKFTDLSNHIRLLKEKHGELEKERLYGPDGVMQPKNKLKYDRIKAEQKTNK